MPQDCIFCQIAQGDAATDVIYQDDEVTAFHDAHPQAPTHTLIIPNRHIRSLKATDDEDSPLLGKLLAVARDLAEEAGVAQSGYRLVLNTDEQSGQTVFHLHLHLLGGRRMGWPPG